MKLISHPKEGNYKEKLLVDHLYNVALHSKNEVENHQLNLSKIEKKDIVRLSFLIGLFHDIGKATTWFQNYIQGKAKPSLYTNHSLLSGIFAYFAVLEEMKHEVIAYVAFQVIYRHHTHLTSFDMSGEKLNFDIIKSQIKNILNYSFLELSEFYKLHSIDISFIKDIDLNDFYKIIRNSDELVSDIASIGEEAIELFFLNNYLFSLLIDFDKLDAARIDNAYFKGNLSRPITDIISYIDYCRESNPDKFNPDIPINNERNRFIQEIATNDKISSKNHFYSITAPTGIGKTFGCVAFTHKLQLQLSSNMPRIIYCLPYTSIIDQNYKEFEKIMIFSLKDEYKRRPQRYLLKHHYQSEKVIKKSRTEKQATLRDYLNDQLLIESWQASMIVTTFMQVFHSVIGYRNRSLKKFHNIVNSIIILDEVQNIDPDYYKLMQKTFKVLGSCFNVYFLQITATQPEILNPDDVIEIIDSDYYMKHDLFNRVSLKIKSNPQNTDDFATSFCCDFKENNCLVVVNTKRVAKELYEIISKVFDDYYTFCLTTYLLPFDRKNQLDEIRNHLGKNDKIIVISTQLIEAGVDVSFKNVYRDMGPLDSIIQVAGRCNRNGELGFLNGKMTLINLDNSNIYKRILVQYVKEILKKENYSSSDFFNLAKNYFHKFQFLSKSNQLIKAIQEMNYDTQIEGQIPVSDFSLIKDNVKKNIYILRTQEAQNDMDAFIQLKRDIKENVSKKLKEEMRLKIEKLKYKLLPFQISVYGYELENYKDYIEPQNEIAEDPYFPYQYLTYEIQKKYAYDKKVGFLVEPKRELSSVLTI